MLIQALEIAGEVIGGILLLPFAIAALYFIMSFVLVVVLLLIGVGR